MYAQNVTKCDQFELKQRSFLQIRCLLLLRNEP